MADAQQIGEFARQIRAVFTHYGKSNTYLVCAGRLLAVRHGDFALNRRIVIRRERSQSQRNTSRATFASMPFDITRNFAVLLNHLRITRIVVVYRHTHPL